MILLDISTDASVEKATWFRSYAEENGLTVVTVSPKEYGLEYEKRSVLYIISLWLVSFCAMVTNLAQAISLKIFSKRENSLRQILWEMGRDINHVSSFAVDRFSRFNHRAKFGAAGFK